MKARLMITCLADAFYGEAAIAATEVLEHAGVEVLFPEGQTCCGQPPFNSGVWEAAMPVAENFLRAFPNDGIPVVCPSGSCTAMIRDGYAMMGLEERTPECLELGEYMIRKLGVSAWPETWGALEPRSVAFHRSCHGRMLGLGDLVEKLVGSIPGVELVEIEAPEQCCGFGGAFSALQTFTSSKIGDEKLRTLSKVGASQIVSGDMGCLMHLKGLAGREGLTLKMSHYATLMAEAIKSKGAIA